MQSFKFIKKYTAVLLTLAMTFSQTPISFAGSTPVTVNDQGQSAPVSDPFAAEKAPASAPAPTAQDQFESESPLSPVGTFESIIPAETTLKKDALDAMLAARAKEKPELTSAELSAERNYWESTMPDSVNVQSSSDKTTYMWTKTENDQTTVFAFSVNKDNSTAVSITGDVTVPAGAALSAGTITLNNVSQIASGGSHSLATLSDSGIQVWGSNSSGIVETGTLALSGIIDNLTPPLSEEQKSSILLDYDEAKGYALIKDANDIVVGYSWDSKTKPGYSYELSRATDASGNITWVVLTHAPIQQEVPPAVAAITATIQADLMNNFGFSGQQLKDLLASGQIKIDFTNLKDLRAIVTFAANVALPQGANLFNLLGSNQLPEKIEYQLGEFSGLNEITGQDSYYFVSGNFRLGNLSYDLKYYPALNPMMGRPSWPEDGKLKSISVTEVDDICNGNPQCMAPTSIKLIKDISYTYDNYGNVKAQIVYHDGSQGAITSRDVMLNKMADNQLHIQSIIDLDKDGSVLAKSLFSYNVATTEQACLPSQPSCNTTVVTLDHITRTDANGKLLSTISGIRPMAVGAPDFYDSSIYAAVQTFPGDETALKLNFGSLEGLLAQAMKNETNYEPPLPQAVVDFVKNIQVQVGDGFKVGAALQKNGTYLVSVIDAKVYAMAPTSGLKEMQFTISENGTLANMGDGGLDGPSDKILINATYYGKDEDIQVDAQLLFEAMRACVAEQCTEQMEKSDLHVLAEMAHLSVAKVDNAGAIYFTKEGKNYKTYRNEAGMVQLVQVVVPFKVTVSINAYHSTQKDVTISVDENGKADVTYYGAHYSGTFDQATNMLVVKPYAGSTWTFKFDANNSNRSLVSMDQAYEGSGYSSVNSYSFGSDGRLASTSGTSKWNNAWSSGESTWKNSYLYVQVNGKMLIASMDSSSDYSSTYSNQKSTSNSTGHQSFTYDDQGRQIASKNTYSFASNYNGQTYNGQSSDSQFFDYDSAGNQIMAVYISDSDYNGTASHYASYNQTDRASGTMTYVYAQNLSASMSSEIQSAKDFAKIDTKALVKNVSYYKDGSFRDYRFNVQYANDGNGNFVARKVSTKDGTTYIVIGEPDVLSEGERLSDDIALQNWQMVNGYSVYYGEGYKQDDKGNYVSAGYGLVFSKWEQTANGSWKQTTIVIDFPKDSSVMLDGKKYQVQINDGKITLVQPEIVQITKIIQSDLINTFGFSEEVLAYYLKNGKIKIQADVKNLQASVFFDHTGLSSGFVNLFDSLGSNMPPAQIDYTLAADSISSVLCVEGAACNQLSPTYHLVSGKFNRGSGYFVELSYMPETKDSPFSLVGPGDNQLKSVKIYNEDPNDGTKNGQPFNCLLSVCVSADLIQDISYSYESGIAGAHIFYPDNSQVPVVIRDVSFKKTIDGYTIINQVIDKDKDGKVLVQSKVELLSISYMVLYGENSAWRNLGIKVTRTDSAGNLVSTIDANQGTIVLADETTQYVEGENLEELLAQALKIDSATLPPTVTSYVKDLQQQLGDGFKVATAKQKDGTYLVNVLDIKTYEMAPTSGLYEMHFSLSASFQLIRESIRATYYGSTAQKMAIVDGQLLFESFSKCPYQACPLIEKVLTDFSSFSFMSAIRINSVEDGVIHFTKNGGVPFYWKDGNYKAYRDESSQVRLKEEILI